MSILIIGIINLFSIIIVSYLSQRAINKANKADVKDIAEQTKQGENEAIKKDIEEISSKIKSVETAIIEISSKKQDKFFQLRNAIIDFSNDLTILVECKFRIIPIGNDLLSPVEIREKFKDFISQWASVNSSLRRIMLFSNDDNQFIKKINEQFLFIAKQFEITVEYYDVLLSNLIIVEENTMPTSKAVKNMTNALQKYIDRRDGSEKVQNKSFDSYNLILQILNSQLMKKYDEK